MKWKQWILPGIIIVIGVLFVFFKFGLILPQEGNEAKNQGEEEKITKDYIKNLSEKNSKSEDKDEILLKIMDAPEYFTTVQGKYETIDKKNNEKSTTLYAIDNEKKRGMETSYIDGAEVATVMSFGKTKKRITFEEGPKTYMVADWPPVKKKKDEDTKKYTATERLYGKGDDNKPYSEYIFGNDVVSWQLVSVLLRYDDWQYKETTFMDRPCYLLSGKIDDSLSESYAGPFKMTVDKETGIVFSFKNYDDDNKQLKYEIKTKDIKIDQGVDEKLFQKDKSGYKKKKPFDPTGEDWYDGE